MQLVVAGFGNVLRRDDGFGVAVARHLIDGGVPDRVRVLEIGIGGIHLVQELLDGVDGLVVVDALDVGKPPGTLQVIAPDVVDPAGLDVTARRDTLADMHYATPERALMLARGLQVLPEDTVIVGCQAEDASSYAQGLSERVAASVAPAGAQVRRIVTELGVPWP